jgi:hypothetical protein
MVPPQGNRHLPVVERVAILQHNTYGVTLFGVILQHVSFQRTQKPNDLNTHTKPGI